MLRVQQCNWLHKGAVVAVVAVGLQVEFWVLSRIYKKRKDTRTASSAFPLGPGEPLWALDWLLAVCEAASRCSFCVAVDQDYRAAGFALDKEWDEDVSSQEK